MAIDQTIKKIQSTQAKLEKAKADVHTAHLAFREAIRQAHKAGHFPKEIVEVTGWSHPIIYQILNHKGGYKD